MIDAKNLYELCEELLSTGYIIPCKGETGSYDRRIACLVRENRKYTIEKNILSYDVSMMNISGAELRSTVTFDSKKLDYCYIAKRGRHTEECVYNTLKSAVPI